jgi:hypothetical protein
MIRIAITPAAYAA